MPRAQIIDLEAEQSVIRYTVGDDLFVVAEVLETVSGVKGPIIWGAATAQAQIRTIESDAVVVPTVTMVADVTTNGQMSILVSAANTFLLYNTSRKFSVQVTRGGKKLTYWAGILEPRLEATHP